MRCFLMFLLHFLFYVSDKVGHFPDEMDLATSYYNLIWNGVELYLSINCFKFHHPLT